MLPSSSKGPLGGLAVVLAPRGGAAPRVLVAMICAWAIPGCGGDRSADKLAWSEAPHEESRPLRETEYLDGQPGPIGAEPAAPSSAPLGVRHDVMIAPDGPRTERCACLAVEVGRPRDRRFQWQNGAPDVGNDALTIAVSARGVSCPGGPEEDKRRASISAVDSDGPNVFVEVEELPEGRPIASGAIIPKPGPGGGIFVRPKTPKLPYARTNGGVACKVM